MKSVADFEWLASACLRMFLMLNALAEREKCPLWNVCRANDMAANASNNRFPFLLSRDEKEPLKEEKKITPIIDSGLRRESSVTFDGKRSISKTGFVGKDSAV
jgi:hypothetical protein